MCFSRVEDYFCNRCQQSEHISYFFFKRIGFTELLNHRFNRTKKDINNVEDIYDGSIYKSLPPDFINNVNNVTFSWNSDGVPLCKSSKISIWPFYLTINELPFKLRGKKEYTIIAGLWFGVHKPPANLFLTAFKNDQDELYTNDKISFQEFNFKLLLNICASRLPHNMKIG